MNRLRASSTKIETGTATPANAAGLSYSRIVCEPQLMERLIRDARRARAAALARVIAVLVNALGDGARHIARAGRAALTRAAAHFRSALAKANPPARHC